MVMTPVDLDSLSQAELKERHLDLPERFCALEEQMMALKCCDEMDVPPFLARRCYMMERTFSSGRLCDVGGVHRSRSGEVGVSGSRR